MRTARAYILIIAALLIAACTNEQDMPDLGPVGYAPVVATSHARAMCGANIYPKDVPFSVWVRSLSEEQHWATAAEESRLFIDNEEVVWNGTEWTTATKHIWPWGNSLSLMAYSPAGANATFSVRGGVEFHDIDVLAEGNGNLMFANPVSDQLFVFNNGIINIPFTSALSQVSFAVIPHVPDDVKVVVKEISVRNIMHCGSFCSLPEASWAPTGDTCEVLFFEGEESAMGSEFKKLGVSEMVLPQHLNARVKVVCDFVTPNTTIPNQEFEIDEKMIWRVGKCYDYTIKIYMDGIGFMHDVILDEFDK